MKFTLYLISSLLFNVSSSFIDTDRIESLKLSFKENDSIIQSDEFNYPYSITETDSFKYPINIQIELVVKDIRDLTIKENYFWAAYNFNYYSTLDSIYISKLNDTINLEMYNFITPDYQEGDQLYLGLDPMEKTIINDGSIIYQQGAYIENNFYHKWDLRNYPFDNQEIKLKFITYDDTSIVRMQQAKHVKSSFNDKMDNLIDGYTVTAIDYTNNFEESTKIINSKDGRRKQIKESLTYTININRDGSFLYFKLFFGTFLSFLISYLVFFIHKDEFETRITLSVGGIFGAVGNRYFVESIMPEVQVLTKGDLINNLVILLIVMNIFIVIMQYNKNINWRIINNNKKPAILSALIFTILNLIIIYS